MTEPSLLDYLAAKLRFWRPSPEGMPSLRRLWSEDAADAAPEPAAPAPRSARATGPAAAAAVRRRRWRLEAGDGPSPLAVASALVLAVVGQMMFTLDRPAVAAGIVLLAGAAGAAMLAVGRGEVSLPIPPSRPDRFTEPLRVRPLPAGVAAVAAIFAGAAAADNRLGWPGIAAWLAAVGLALVALAPRGIIARWLDRLAATADRHHPLNRPGRPALLILALLAVAVLLRTRDLAAVPAEMVSEHAELILAMVRAGAAEPPVVFPWTPGGLEPLPVVLGALLAPLAGGLSFAALKLGTVLAGLATLPFVYLAGREVGGRGVALGALALAGVASWPDLVSRTGLADAWLPPFAAAALFLLLRAVRTGSALGFAGAGVVIGLAVQTSSLGRALPVAAAVLLGVAVIPASPARRRRLLAGLAVVLVLAGLAGLPTIVAGTTTAGGVPAGWWLGAANGSADQGILAGLGERFARVLAMPLLCDGSTWLHGGTERPALDRVAGALLVIGVAITAFGVPRRRSPAGGLVLLALPLLLMPAWLAALEPFLAPSPLRCGAAQAPVFVLAGVGLAAVWSAAASSLRGAAGRAAAVVAVTALVALSALAGRMVVHGPFAERWNRSAWNVSELGATVRAGLELGVPAERARVVPWPHWVDTRLVAVEAGLPGADLAVDPEALDEVAGRGGPQLYLVHPADRRNLQRLRERLPEAVVVERRSRVEGRSFLLVLAVGVGGGG